MRRSSLVRRVAAASVVVLALTGLTACNDSDADPAAAEPTETAASETPSASPSAEPAGEEIDPSTFIADVLGALEDATTAHVTVEVTGGPASLAAEGDIDYSTSPPSMAMAMSKTPFGPGKAELRLVGGALYLSFDFRSASKWVEVPLDGKGSPLGANLAEQLNPGAGLALVEDAVTEVTLVGDEEVDGETLEHYTMQVRTDTARGLQEQLGGISDDLDLDLPSLVTFDVWLDDTGLMRRSEMALGDVGSVTTTMSGWGEPVDIEAPPVDEVMQFGG
ncbi:LppX_LprAFG lipoprotein [Nocardioides sp. SR21]|uniref:LppX_LprAFG lipoprotein n=1 Tax=Nocardioides sp. SR21 TaxID=2919501 RepID=UPI001FAAEE2B|nr:LppX_LprAFG lipoprotein [Nocardioides sp. SR21]